MHFHTNDSYSYHRLPKPNNAACAHSYALIARIHAALNDAGGWLPFHRYMALALYTPGLGYYSGGAKKFGYSAADGSDFITAPELSPFFARALACAVGEALEASGTYQLMEFGAGTGRLAAELLLSLDKLGVRCDRYTIVEVSAPLREQQQATLTARAAQRIACVRWISALPKHFEGVVIGNEVLDAMPVRLFARINGAWFERGVSIAKGKHGKQIENTLEWQDWPINEDRAVTALGTTIQGDHDYLTESHEAAVAFIHTVCNMLTRGALFFIDYGFNRDEYYHPQRVSGTLMCHYQHHAHTDPFFYPGLQDITAHVEFSSLAQAALTAGAELLGYTSQARFLINCGILNALNQLDPHHPQHFLPAANAVQKLLSEAEMGELFKVIGLCRGIRNPLSTSAFAVGDRSFML